MSEVFRSSQDGFELIGLRNEFVEITVAPALGAKIVSLKDQRTGREWMWHPGDQLKLFANSLGDPFEQSTLVGADECLPSVAACVAEGRQIPDHGEVWSMPWQLDDAQLQSGKIALSVSLPISPFEFTRTVSLNQWTVNFDYRLRNRSDHPAHFLWAFHPLLRIEPGDELHFLHRLTEVELETTSWPEDKQGDKWPWPRPRKDIDLEKLDLGEKSAYVKCFAHSYPEGIITISNAVRKEAISFHLHSPYIQTIGFWLTHGGWNGHHHVAIEPTNAPADSLERAIKENLCEAIRPGAISEWSFRIILGP